MSDDFEFMSQGEDPAADFLARESEELGELGEELGISQATAPIFAVDTPPMENGDTFVESTAFNNSNYEFGSRFVFLIVLWKVNPDFKYGTCNRVGLRVQ